MTKSQTKMSKLATQIQRLAKGLNKFTISNILQLIDANDLEIELALKELEEEFIIKKISDTEYLYSKIKSISSDIILNVNKPEFFDKEWLTLDEVCAITYLKPVTVKRKCRKGEYEIKFVKRGKFKDYLINKNSLNLDKKPLQKFFIDDIISPDKIPQEKVIKTRIFKNDAEQAYFDKLPLYAQKRVFKYITIFKLVGSLSGKALKDFLVKLKAEHPEYKTSYCRFMTYRKAYIKEGLKALVPKYGPKHCPSTCVPKDMYEKFKELYLSPNRYSLAKSVDMLVQFGFEKDLIPSDKTFERLLLKEFDRAYITAVRNTPLELPELRQLEPNYVPAKQSIYEKYIDAANAYSSHIDKSTKEIAICQKGYIKNHLNPFFKRYKISEITNEVIIKFQQEKLSQGFAIGSIKRFTSTLTDILKHNNTDIKRLNFTSNETLLPVTEQRILNKKEIEEIKRTNIPKLWIICLGINIGELFALDYSNINFEDKTIKIDKILYKGTILKHRKQYKIRTLKLPAILLDTLQKEKTGRIFKEEKIDDYDILLNTHVKLLLDKNVTLNIIYKNLALHNINDFEIRFGFLLPQKLEDGFNILG